MWKKLGALSIGYAPRPRSMDDFLRLRPGLRLIEVGALDGVDPTSIPSLKLEEIMAGPGPRPAGQWEPEPGKQYPPDTYRLITHMNPWQVVSIEHRDLMPLLQKKIDELNKTDADAILIQCTGLFPGLVSAKPLLIPHLVFAGAMQWLKPAGKVAVVCPVEGQKKAAAEKWRAEGLNPDVLVASPYSSRDIEKTGLALKAMRPEAVILDCFGFAEESKEGLSAYVECPVLSIRMIVRDLLLQCFNEPAGSDIP